MLYLNFPATLMERTWYFHAWVVQWTVTALLRWWNFFLSQRTGIKGYCLCSKTPFLNSDRGLQCLHSNRLSILVGDMGYLECFFTIAALGIHLMVHVRQSLGKSKHIQHWSTNTQAQSSMWYKLMILVFQSRCIEGCLKEWGLNRNLRSRSKSAFSHRHDSK